MDEKMDFVGRHGWKGFCDAGIYQKTVMRDQISIHSVVSLHVLDSSKIGVHQLCMEPMTCVCRQG
jgi:hypothetical protein